MRVVFLFFLTVAGMDCCSAFIGPIRNMIQALHVSCSERPEPDFHLLRRDMPFGPNTL